MQEIIALFTVWTPHLSVTTGRHLSRVVLALFAMTGQGGVATAYTTLFQHGSPLDNTLLGVFSHTSA